MHERRETSGVHRAMPPPADAGDFDGPRVITRDMLVQLVDRVNGIDGRLGGGGNGFWGGLPPWVRIAALLFAGGSVPTGVLAFVPFEGKDAARVAHEALQAQIDALKKDLPAELVKALDAREERRRGRR